MSTSGCDQTALLAFLQERMDSCSQGGGSPVLWHWNAGLLFFPLYSLFHDIEMLSCFFPPCFLVSFSAGDFLGNRRVFWIQFSGIYWMLLCARGWAAWVRWYTWDGTFSLKMGTVSWWSLSGCLSLYIHFDSHQIPTSPTHFSKAILIIFSSPHPRSITMQSAPGSFLSHNLTKC